MALTRSNTLASIMSPSLATLSLVRIRMLSGRDVSMDHVLRVRGFQGVGDLHAHRESKSPLEQVKSGAGFAR